MGCDLLMGQRLFPHGGNESHSSNSLICWPIIVATSFFSGEYRSYAGFSCILLVGTVGAFLTMESLPAGAHCPLLTTPNLVLPILSRFFAVAYLSTVGADAFGEGHRTNKRARVQDLQAFNENSSRRMRAVAHTRYRGRILLLNRRERTPATASGFPGESWPKLWPLCWMPATELPTSPYSPRTKAIAQTG